MVEIHSPKVSVVMPVYKGDEFLSEAVDSILNQTFTDFEFIIICDDPTEKTRQILDKYKQSDSRIKVYYQEREGLVNSLNRGCSLARGEYIARMDADDISLPERFEKQIFFLDNNADIGVVGTDIKLINGCGKPFHDFEPPNIPIEPRAIQWSLLFFCCLHHPTVMFRKSIYSSTGGYSVDFVHAEDYEFWLRISSGTNIANLPDKLVYIRKHGSNITNLHRETQQRNANIANQSAVSNILQKRISLPVIQALRYPHDISNKKYVIEAADLLQNVYRIYCKKYALSNSEKKHIREDAARRMEALAIASLRNNHIALSLKIWVREFLINPKTAVKMIIATGFEILKNNIGRSRELSRQGYNKN